MAHSLLRLISFTYEFLWLCKILLYYNLHKEKLILLCHCEYLTHQTRSIIDKQLSINNYLNFAQTFTYLHSKFMHRSRFGIKSAVVGIAKRILGNGKLFKTRMSHKVIRVTSRDKSFLRLIVRTMEKGSRCLNISY